MLAIWDGLNFVVLGYKESMMNSRLMEVIVILCILQRNLQWAAVLILILPVFASAQNKQAEAENRGEATAPTVTLKTFSRMVTLEMVVKDSRGRHVTGLKPSDFQVSEQTPSQSRAKRRQKIAEFHEVTMANLAAEVGLPGGLQSVTVHLEISRHFSMRGEEISRARETALDHRMRP